MRLDEECPGCGDVVKQETITGRFDYHGWANGCQVTYAEDVDPGVEPDKRTP